MAQPACGGIATSLGGRDAGPQGGDSGPAPEASSGTDSGVGFDSSMGLDGRSAIDSTSGMDGTSGIDSTSGTDSSSPTDSSSETDGGISDADSGTGCATGSNVLSLPFSQYPQLMTVGGSVAVQASGYSDPTCGQPDVIVLYRSLGIYVALSASCTHACCTVSFMGSDLVCPCHGTTFDLSGVCTGDVTYPPLAVLSVCSDANGVYVSW